MTRWPLSHKSNLFQYFKSLIWNLGAKCPLWEAKFKCSWIMVLRVKKHHPYQKTSWYGSEREKVFSTFNHWCAISVSQSSPWLGKFKYLLNLVLRLKKYHPYQKNFGTGLWYGWYGSENQFIHVLLFKIINIYRK